MLWLADRSGLPLWMAQNGQGPLAFPGVLGLDGHLARGRPGDQSIALYRDGVSLVWRHVDGPSEPVPGLWHICARLLGLKSTGALIWLGAAVTIPLALLTVTDPNGVFGTLSWNAQTGIYTPNLSILATVLSLPYFAILVHSGILLYRTYLITDSAMERSRLRYLMAGLAAILIGILSNLSSSLKQYPIDVTAAILNAGLIAYAIFRYQLLDVSLVIRKGLIYSIPTLTLGIAYFLVLSLAINLIHISLGSQVFLLSLLLAVAAALVAEPVRVKLQSVVDRLFFRESYDSTAMLQRLSRKAATLLDLDELGKMILDDIQKTMHIRSGVFLIKHSPSGNYVVRARQVSTQNLRRDGVLLRTIRLSPRCGVAKPT